MESQQSEHLFSFLKAHPNRKEYNRDFFEYLNNQAWIYMKPFSLLAMVAWLWYGLYADNMLHPEYPDLIYFRMGMSAAGVILFIISFMKKLKRYAFFCFFTATAYVVLSCSFFTGRIASDPNYVSGMQLIILMIVMGPFTFRSILILYIFSALSFFIGVNISGVRLYSFGHMYSMNNLILTYLIGILAAFIIERFRFLFFFDRLRLKEAHEKIWSEVEIAKKIQTVLLPKNPGLNDFEIAVYMDTADEVGGDYYDIINIDGREWIVIGDVAGHGISAGLIMMMVQTSIKTVLDDNSSLNPSELLIRVNNSLLSNIKLIGEERYMTITVLAYQEQGVFFFSGLHQDMVVYRSEEKKVEIFETDGSWLGIERDLDEILHDGRLQLYINDVLFLYTDGATEAWHKRSSLANRDFKTDMYGQERLIDAFEKMCKKADTPEEIIRGVLDTLKEYTITDDVTLMALKRIH